MAFFLGEIFGMTQLYTNGDIYDFWKKLIKNH